MHGYFVDIRVYKKAKDAVTTCQNFEEIKQKEAEKLLKEQSSSRISLNSDLVAPAINKSLAKKIHEKNSKSGKAIETDDRFRELFKDSDFIIDEESDTFKLLNSSNHMKKFNNRQESDEEVDSNDTLNKLPADKRVTVAGYSTEEESSAAEESSKRVPKKKFKKMIEKTPIAHASGNNFKALNSKKSFSELLSSKDDKKPALYKNNKKYSSSQSRNPGDTRQSHSFGDKNRRKMKFKRN